MNKVATNKSSLSQLRQKRRLYKRFLPALDLKRQQLLTFEKEARAALAECEQEIDELNRSIVDILKPLGGSQIDFGDLVTVESFVLDEENRIGARLPVIREIRFRKSHWSILGKPSWVDFLAEALERRCALELHRQVRQERVVRLHQQVRRMTQRVNLFEKVLVPRADREIKRIQIGLAEQERSAVVRAKLAKKKNAR